MPMNPVMGSAHSLVTPLVRAGRRFVFPIFTALSVFLLVLGKADPAAIAAVRAGIDDLMAPVLAAARAPGAVIGTIGAKVHAATFLYAENQRLAADNASLLQWQAVAQQLATENADLRGLLHYSPKTMNWFVTARVIGTDGGSFARQLLIDQGSLNGVAGGQAAMTGDGLVGRVVRVGRDTARILLLTDIDSRIPVTIEPAHIRAILAGDNGDQPSLVFMPNHAQPHAGDRVVTSGDGGVFPPGIPVGIVALEDGDASAVQPFADADGADYLRIADFGLSGVLPASAVPLPKPAPRPRHAHRSGHAREPAQQ